MTGRHYRSGPSTVPHPPVPGYRTRRLTAALLAALTLATATLTLLGVDTPARLYLTVAFVLLAPGWAVTAYLHLDEPALLWSVSVAVGVALSIVVAQVLVSAGFWHPWGAMLALEIATLAVLGHHLLRARPGPAARHGEVTG